MSSTNYPDVSVSDRRAAFLAALEERLEHWAPYLAALILAAFALTAVVKAIYKPLWFDEIISILIANQPHAAQMWEIAKSGADGQPPAYDYIIRASVRLLGNDPVGLRLPSILGFLTFCWTVYRMVSFRLSRAYGLIGLLFPALGGVWYYATEGRPYGLLLAFSGLAALSWQSIAWNRLRHWALAGLFLSLVAAINVHFFAPVLLIALGLVELVRTYLRKKIDWPVWIVFAASPLALLPYLSVIRESRINSGDSSVWFGTPNWYGSPLSTYQMIIEPALLGVVIIGCVVLIALAIARRSFDSRQAAPNDEFILDVALILSFLLLPIPGTVLAKYVTHLFLSRYVIATVLGVTMLVCYGLWWCFRGRRWPAWLCVAGTGLLYAWGSSYEIKSSIREGAIPHSSIVEKGIPAPAIEDGLPLVVADEFTLFNFRYYARPELNRHLYYLSNERAAKRYLGYTIGERIAMGSAPYFGTQVIDYHDFIRQHLTFDVIGGPEWLIAQLLVDKAHVTVLQNSPAHDGGGGSTLFRIQLPTP